MPDATATLHLPEALHQELPIDGMINKVVINPEYGKPRWLPYYPEAIYQPETPEEK